MPRQRVDIKGKRFGLLTVMKYQQSGKEGAEWLCECDCGCYKVASYRRLNRGEMLSCGCLIRNKEPKKAWDYYNGETIAAMERIKRVIEMFNNKKRRVKNEQNK